MLVELLKGGRSPQEIAFIVIVMLLALTLSFSVHEFMHAAVADWLGDPTPRNQGRLTLNPIAHLDPWGTVLLLLAGFGWGKPVMYNPNRLNRFKSYRGMNIMVHLAGVTGNFVLGFIASIAATILAGVMYKLGLVEGTNAYAICYGIHTALTFTYSFSMMLLAFNLLPIPPLDGFHVLEELLPYKVRGTQGYRKFQYFAPYGIWILFLASRFTGISIINYLITIIGFPFEFVIAFVCGLINNLFLI